MSDRAGLDLAVVGAGIVGLATALAAARRGLKVAVIERNTKAVGASIRNFGFVTVSGQKAGDHWARARRARDVWAEIAPEAGIEILHRGLVMPAYRAEAQDVLEAFLETPMGAGCRRLTPAKALEYVPSLRREGMRAALYSPHELRVESKDAIPKLAAWLEQKYGIAFYWNTSAIRIDGEDIETSRGTLNAGATVICPGDDFSTLFPERIAAYGLNICTLQMLRVAPETPVRFGAAVMSDLSFGRYEGFAELPEGRVLSARLDAEHAEMRACGIHVIAVQSADGSLVVGDSHVYANAQIPFAEERLDGLILDAFDQIFDMPGRSVIARWIGTYASAHDRAVLIDKPAGNIRIVIVTGGTGASTGFGLGEEVVSDIFG